MRQHTQPDSNRLQYTFDRDDPNNGERDTRIEDALRNLACDYILSGAQADVR